MRALSLCDPAFLGGIPFGTGGGLDPDVETMLANRTAAGFSTGFGAAVDAAYAEAISDYVTALKAISGHWDTIIQLVVMAGANAPGAAMFAIKGPDFINRGVDDVDVNPKTGSTGDGSGEYIETTYSGTVSGTGQNNFHTYGYFTGIPSSSPRTFYGQGNTSNGTWVMRHNGTSTVMRCRSNTADTITWTPTAGDYGISRGSSSSYDYLLPNGGGTITRTSQTPVSRPLFILATSNDANNSATNHSNARCLVWALGTATTLSNYTAPTADLVTALNAIP